MAHAKGVIEATCSRTNEQIRADFHGFANCICKGAERIQKSESMMFLMEENDDGKMLQKGLSASAAGPRQLD